MCGLITLKLMAEVPDEAAAARFQNEVQAKIGSFGAIKQSEVKRYWTIPELFEVTLTLQPRNEPEVAFDGILSSLGEGWERHDVSEEEQWAVWNPSEGSKFLSSHVRWAHVDRFPESDISTI
jgi:hypothetical protein